MKKIVFIAALSVGLAGCETMNSMTKGIDDAFASVNEAMGRARLLTLRHRFVQRCVPIMRVL